MVAQKRAQNEMIDDLLPEEEARFDEFVQRWIGIGLCTGESDRKAAEELIPAMYAADDKPAPKSIVWCESPAAVVRHVERMPNNAKPAHVDSCQYGQFDANWLSFYSFLYEVVGKRSEALRRDIEPLRPFMAFAEHTSWAHLDTDTAWVCGHPSILHTDAEGNLHHLDGPAIAWPDGWGVYCVRGRVVEPDLVINRKTMPVERALTERNLELRSVIQQLIGWTRILAEFKPTVVHDSGNRLIGQLLECEVAGERSRFLKAYCPANEHEVIIRVNPSIQTANEASASTYPVPRGVPFLEGKQLVTGVRL